MRYESSTASQDILLLLMAVAGTLLVSNTFSAVLIERNMMDTNALPAFILGMFLIVSAFVGAWGRAWREVIIDRDSASVIIHDRVFTKQSEEVIPFSQIKELRVSQFGLTLGERRYSVVLVCHDEREVSLFWPAYFKGSFVKSVMESVKLDIERTVFSRT